MPTPKSKYICVGGKAGPVEKAITKPINSLRIPKTNRTQAAIVARDFNLDGILYLLANKITLNSG
jgi:hypothetical protein